MRILRILGVADCHVHLTVLQATLLPFLQEKVDSVAETPGGGPWQGPALYCYNDGPGFSEEDFRAIRFLRAESKQTRNAATGRFGLGFNSVYHITDAPSLISNGHTLFFDPHRHCWATGGFECRMALGESFDAEGTISPIDFQDQFAPYRLFGGPDDRCT